MTAQSTSPAIPKGWEAALVRYRSGKLDTGPRKSCTPAESQLLNEGLRHLVNAPISDVLITDALPRTRNDQKNSRYLWAVQADEVPYALEKTDFAGLSEIKHSNLTGAGRAYCAGEMWFLGGDTFVFNGNSGRYGIVDEGQISELCQLFSEMGYRVACPPYDEETGTTVAFFPTSDIRWVEAQE